MPNDVLIEAPVPLIVVDQQGVATPMCSRTCPRFIAAIGKYGRNYCRHGESSPRLCVPATLAAWRKLNDLDLDAAAQEQRS